MENLISIISIMGNKNKTDLQIMNQDPAKEYAICCTPVSSMRAEPSHKSEIVSQQLFGEPCKIIERVSDKGDHWVKVKSRYEGYEGWCQQGHITGIEESQYKSEDKRLMDGWINKVEYNGKKMIVPMGSSLSVIPGGQANWNKNIVRFNGQIWNKAIFHSKEEIVRELGSRFLNTSYLWGGKSVFGVDCSGFAQTIYKFLDIPLPRDAYQQAAEGEVVGFLQEARCGDLAFFDNAEGRITHVGLLLNEHEILHSSVNVRVDKIDTQGIINQDTFERTHKLRIIKRYF